MTDTSSNEPLQQAELLLAARRSSEAAALAYAEAAKRPDDPRPFLIASRAELDLRDFTRAGAAAASAIRIDPDSVPAYRLLALARINAVYASRSAIDRRNRGRTALPPAERAASLSPGDVDSLCVLAEAAAVAGQTRKAIQIADEAVRIAPFVPTAWLVRARVARLTGDLPVAEADIREALRLEPDNYSANNELGLILGARGKRAESLSQFKSTAALDPSRQTAPRNVLRYGQGFSYLLSLVLFSPLILLGRGVLLTVGAAIGFNAFIWSWGTSRRVLERRTLTLVHWRSQHRTPVWRRLTPDVSCGEPIKRNARMRLILARGALVIGATFLIMSILLAIVLPSNQAAPAFSFAAIGAVFILVFAAIRKAALVRPKRQGAASLEPLP